MAERPARAAPFWIYGIGLAVLLLASYRAYGKRDVIQYSDIGEITQVSEVLTLHTRITGLRDDCTLQGGPTDTVIIDSGGLEFFINQRGGFRTNIPKRDLEVTLQLEMPRFAREGPARLMFRHVFQCGPWRVHQQSPAYSFEAIGGADDRK